MDNYSCKKTAAIWRREKKKKKDQAVHYFQVAYIHNPVKLFGLLTLTRYNVGNNLTTNNTSNILSESLTKISHGFTMN